MAVAGEVTRHGQAHPYSWSITIVSLRSKKSEECHRSELKTKLLSMFLTVTCQHALGACQSHSRPVLNLREASRKYVELSPSTPPFLTLRFYEKDLTPTPNLLRISGRYSLRLGIFGTPSARAYLFRKKQPGTESMIRVPKKACTEKHCNLCKKHGGVHTMQTGCDPSWSSL